MKLMHVDLNVCFKINISNTKSIYMKEKKDKTFNRKKLPNISLSKYFKKNSRNKK